MRIEYNKKRKANRYVAPFSEARDNPHDTGNKDIAELLDKLSSLAEELSRYRERRNGIVHEIATKVGKINLQVTNDQQRRFDEEQESGFEKIELDFTEIKQLGHEADERRKRELYDCSQEIVGWYRTLIDASNYVFQVEYFRRNQHRYSGTASRK